MLLFVSISWFFVDLFSIETPLTEGRVEFFLIADQINLLLRNPEHLFSKLNGLLPGSNLTHSHWLDVLRLEQSDLLCRLDWRWRIFRLLLLLQVHHA